MTTCDLGLRELEHSLLDALVKQRVVDLAFLVVEKLVAPLELFDGGGEVRDDVGVRGEALQGTSEASRRERSVSYGNGGGVAVSRRDHVLPLSQLLPTTSGLVWLTPMGRRKGIVL